MPEITYYSRGIIQVTSARAIFGNKTYAMANVTSVEVETRAKTRWWILLASLGFLLLVSPSLLSLVASLLGPYIGPYAFPLYGLLLILPIGFGVLLYTRLPRKYTHSVRIGSASGETDALTSPNKEEIEAIVNAINQALIDRS